MFCLLVTWSILHLSILKTYYTSLNIFITLLLRVLRRIYFSVHWFICFRDNRDMTLKKRRIGIFIIIQYAFRLIFVFKRWILVTLFHIYSILQLLLLCNYKRHVRLFMVAEELARIHGKSVLSANFSRLFKNSF